MKKYKFLGILLAFILVFASSVPIAYAEPTIAVTSMSVDMSGSTKLIGYISEAVAKNQVTLLVTYGEEIVYIDQVETGNNGTFLFKFTIDAKYSEKTITYNIGSDTGAKAYKANYKLPYMPPGFEHIENNSVIYGHDAYTANSIYLSDSMTVTDSIIHGGNIIFFKIGDKWYDLMNPKATSSAFFVDENATADSKVKTKTAPLRYYYYGSKVTEFAND